MSLSNNTRNKIGLNSLFRSSTDILTWAIIAIQVIIAIAAFPSLPSAVPIHWGINGQPNGYGPKWVATLLWPLMSIGLYVLLRVLMIIGPRLGSRSNLVANARVRDVIVMGIILFLLIIQLSTTVSILGMPIDIIFITNLAMSVLFIGLGNFMGKLRRNFWMGIRTPWTLTSEVVWERTHRLGGWLFVGIGLLGIVFSFVPLLRVWGVVALILIVVIFLCVYSYVCYRQNIREGSEPLSSPFDQTNEDSEKL